MTFRPSKGLRIVATGASARIALGTGGTGQVRLYSSADVVVNLGGSSVTADDTYTSDALADGNFFLPAGAIEVFNLEAGDTHIAAKAGTGTLYVTTGYGEL